MGAVRLVPETQTALLLEGQALTTIQREILQSSSLKTEIYQEGQAITATYLKILGVSSEEKDIDEANQKSLEPFSDAQKEHICEFFKTRISDVKTDYIYLPNGQEDIAYYLNGYLFANHYAELDMLSPSKQVDALMNRLVSEDGQKFDHVALGFDIERIDQKFLEENLGYNPDTPIEDYRYSEKNIDRVAEKEEQEFRTKFDRRSFAEMIGLMQKYSPEEVLNESNSYHDDVRYQSLLIDLGKVNTDPMYRFIEHYINRDIDREALSQFSVQDFITIAQEKGLLNEEPSVKPWKAITVTQPVNSYTVFTDKLSKEFDNVSDLYQFVNKKLKRSQRRELSSLLSESGRGTPLDTLMAIDSVANVEVNGQSILSLFPDGINEEATEIYLRSSAEIEETSNVAQAEKEKAPDRSQEPSSNAGDSHRNPDSLGDLSPGAASKPVVDEPQPDFPVIAHLNFTTKGERMSTIKPGYHVITNGELNRLNKFAPGLQATAQWYLKELSGSTISYLYQDGETLGKLSVQFSDENFAHLTGISPKGVEMRQVVYDFAQGVGDYGNIQVSHAIKDKSMVLPLLPDILSSQSFVFNDLSEVEKFNRIDLSQAIKTNDEDLLLAIRDVDGVGIPASVMRMKEKLSESLKGKENIVLAVYRQRDGKLDQMSINEEYVKDGGKRFEDILKNDEFSRYQEDRYKEETEQLSFKRDSDGDGISDEEELKHGTNPYDFRSTPSQHSVQEETNLLEEAIETSATVAVSDLIKNKDIAGLNQHLKEGIKAYLNSDHYKEFLTKMSQFNQYSSRNLRLILAQKPDASYLAPYNTWRKFDRHVKRGEKALSVIIPVTYVKKDQQGQPILDKNGRPETGMTFRLKPTTFDVSQTEGKEMPKAAEVKEQLTDLDYANLYRALMSIAKTNDVSVRFEEMAGETKGYYSPAEHQIVLRSHDMNKSQLIKTFIHETAHSELHHSNNPQREQLTRSNAELQAESVAYVVASYYGIDTSDYSFDYLAGWSKDKETLADLEAQLDIVQQEAKSLMVRMDQELEQLRLIQQRQSKQHFEQKLQKFKDQSKQAAEEHKQEMKQEAQSKKEEGLSK
nr:PBECR4 domain-containing protein [Streptococcus anginosus]